MIITLLLRILRPCLVLVLICLANILSAQTISVDEVTGAPVSVMGRQVHRVVDPLSENTLWIDKYATDDLPANPQKESGIDPIVVFHFRVNSTVFEPDYMDNARSLETIDRIFSDTTLFSSNKLAVIVGSASPEGDMEANEDLARERSLSTKKCITDRHPNINRDRISTYAVDEDWEGFRKMVIHDIYMPARNQTIEILDRNLSARQKLNALQKLNGGTTYRYIEANIFPYLRGGASFAFYSIDEPVIPPYPEIIYRDRVVETFRVDTIYIEKRDTTVPPTKKPYYLAIKTNVLYDLALLPNLAIEFSLGKRWSVEVEGMESWWNTKDDVRYRHRIQTAGLEVRKWLGKPDKTPLNGPFLGVYGMGGTYDIKCQKEKGSLSNWSYSAGITYGYATPIARRFTLEFAIGIGYMAGEYKNYTFDTERNCYSKVETFSRSYIGPTKAKISLVWLIGSGVNTKTKRDE